MSSKPTTPNRLPEKVGRPSEPETTSKPIWRRPWVLGLGLLFALFLLVNPLVRLWGSVSVSIRSTTSVSLRANSGEAFAHMVRRWHQVGRIQNPRTLLWLAYFRGDGSRIKAGIYSFQGTVSANRLLNALVLGRANRVVVTIPEGFTAKQIAARLAKHKVLTAAAFLQTATNRQFIQSLNLPFAKTPATLEGLLFPETYVLSQGMLPEQMLRVMVGQFVRQAWPVLQQKAKGVGLNPYQALILASIVEKESGAAKERPLVASVFHNRLKKGMKLQSDPTVIYGIKDYDGNITKKHLRTYTPYNTYRIEGLTPTPIANPGKGSMQAVVQPAKSRYLFFVSKGNGLHYFSSTLRQHNQAVMRYQIQPVRERRKRQKHQR